MRPPAVPADDPLGRLAVRESPTPQPRGPAWLPSGAVSDGYTDGDTDLAWSRITYWRALLASAVDQPPYETDHVRRGIRPERRTRT